MLSLQEEKIVNLKRKEEYTHEHTAIHLFYVLSFGEIAVERNSRNVRTMQDHELFW